MQLRFVQPSFPMKPHGLGRFGDGLAATLRYVMEKQRKIIRRKAVLSRTGQSNTTMWRGMVAGTFPAAVRLGENSVGWFEDEIDEWLESQPRIVSPLATEADQEAPAAT